MANRNFHPIYSLEFDPVMLFGRCTIGAAGAVSGIQGNGISTITKESGTGKFSFTLEDKYTRLLSASIKAVAPYILTAVTSLTGKSEVQTTTFPAKGDATSGDHIIYIDTAGLYWGISLDVTGSADEPTDPLWVAIPAARKVHVDISGETTGAEVAAAVETAFDALSEIPFTTAVTDDAIAVTCTLRGDIAIGTIYDADGTGAGSITSGSTTEGVATSINVANNIFTVVAHGFETGRKIQTSISGGGTLPTGITTTTDYFVIYVDADTFKLATNLANAEAGTAIDITDYGTADKTITYTPAAPFGSSVNNIEITDVTPDVEILAGSKVTFTCYDYAGAAVNPIDGAILLLSLVVRNSSLTGKGE